jgi:hypothetical protein
LKDGPFCKERLLRSFIIVRGGAATSDSGCGGRLALACLLIFILRALLSYFGGIFANTTCALTLTQRLVLTGTNIRTTVIVAYHDFFLS